MVSDESSQECEPTDLTPAKRRGTLTDNLEAAVDQNFFTRTPCSTGIKKEKTEKSGEMSLSRKRRFRGFFFQISFFYV